MSFELDTHEQTVEYVYPFICGLCGYSSSNIDLFHHHFETHGDTVPSSVFHLCEMDNMRNDESESCINVGSFSCKACSHTFPTICNLIHHMDNDPNTQQYIMDLKSKVAYPLTKDYAQVYTHNFPAKRKQKKKQETKKNRNQSRGGKSGPKQISPAQGSNSFDQPFFQAESKQKLASDVYSTVNALDFYNDDDDNSDKEPSGETENSTIDNSEGRARTTREKKTWLACKYCGLSVSKRKIKQHEKEHLTYEGNLKYSQQNMCRCEQCDYVMLNESSARHICELLKPLSARRTRAKRGEPKKGLDQTLTPCPTCNRLFKRYFLLSHIKNMHQEHEPVPCDICGKVFRHKAAMRTHRHSLHEAEKRFHCEMCPYKCRTRAKLRLHLRRHVPERNYACGQCPSRFKTTSELRRHEKIHIKSSDRIRYQCELCPKSYDYKDGLAQHHRRLHLSNTSVTEPGTEPVEDVPPPPKKDKPHKCDQCVKSFWTPSLLENHINTHRGVMPFVCDECPNKYYTTHSLKRHKLWKHTEQNRTFKCEKCPKTFILPISLRKHVQISHKPGDTRLLCGFRTCRHKFEKQDELDKHRSQYHADPSEDVKPPKKEKSYKCDQCVKKFRTQSLLENHINTHRGVMPFVCDECPNKYITTHSLKRHKLWKHTKQNRTFKCEKCPKTFILPISLRKHVQISHKPGDTRLLCGFRTCRHKFEKQDELDKHRSQYHADGLERQCTLCEKSYMNSTGLMQHMRVFHQQKKRLSDKKPRRALHRLLAEKGRSGAAHDHAYTLSILGSAETICDLSTDVAEETIEFGETCKVANKPPIGDTGDCVDNMQLFDDPDDEVLVATTLITEDLVTDVTEDEGIDAYVCHKCPLPQIFTTADAFKLHVQEEHTLSPQFMCGWKPCGVIFNNQEDLNKHRELHKQSSIVQEKVLTAANTKKSIAINKAKKSPSLRADTPKSGRISGKQAVKTSTHGTQTGKRAIAKNVVTVVKQVSPQVGTQTASRRIVLQKTVSMGVPKGTGDGTESIKSQSSPRILLIKKVQSKAVNASAIGTAVDSVVEADKTAKVKTSVALTNPSVPFTKTSVPLTKSAVPLTKTSVPLTNSSVPLTKSAVSLTRTSGPLTNPSVPLTNTSVHLTKTSVPLTKNSVPLPSGRSTRSAPERKPERSLNDVNVEGKQSVTEHSLYSGNAEGLQSGKTKVILIRTTVKKPLKE